MNTKQFELYWANFSPSVGSEQSGLRPCLILETNAFAGQGDVVVCCPLTSNLTKKYRLEPNIKPSSRNGLPQESRILIGQTKALDRSRLQERIGRLDLEDAKRVLNGLALLFDFLGDFRRH